tara:strand:- start:447 stop:611 length:165 start_codon:yes stop_codon:yes gene_type:complete
LVLFDRVPVCVLAGPFVLALLLCGVEAPVFVLESAAELAWLEVAFDASDGPLWL